MSKRANLAADLALSLLTLALFSIALWAAPIPPVKALAKSPWIGHWSHTDTYPDRPPDVVWMRFQADGTYSEKWYHGQTYTGTWEVIKAGISVKCHRIDAKGLEKQVFTCDAYRANDGSYCAWGLVWTKRE